MMALIGFLILSQGRSAPITEEVDQLAVMVRQVRVPTSSPALSVRPAWLLLWMLRSALPDGLRIARSSGGTGRGAAARASCDR